MLLILYCNFKNASLSKFFLILKFTCALIFWIFKNYSFLNYDGTTVYLVVVRIYKEATFISTLFFLLSFPDSFLPWVVFIRNQMVLNLVLLDKHSCQTPIFVKNCSSKGIVVEYIQQVHFSSPLNHIRSTQDGSELKSIMKGRFAPLILNIDLQVFYCKHITNNFNGVPWRQTLTLFLSYFGKCVMNRHSSFFIY